MFLTEEQFNRLAIKEELQEVKKDASGMRRDVKKMMFILRVKS